MRIIWSLLLMLILNPFSAIYAQDDKIVAWERATPIVEYATDEFIVHAITNGSEHKLTDITFKDRDSNVLKVLDLRRAGFAPGFLAARETYETPRSSSIWVNARDMTDEQKREAMHPDAQSDPEKMKLWSSTMTEIYVQFAKPGDRGDQYSGCILINYCVLNFVGDELDNLNTKLVVLDHKGNLLKTVEHIPYAVGEVVLTSDLNFICYSFTEFVGYEGEEAGGPSGLRLLDLRSGKYLIDKTFPVSYISDYEFPDKPSKMGKYIRMTETTDKYGYEGGRIYLIDPPNDLVLYRDSADGPPSDNPERDYKRMSIAAFNALASGK